MPTATSARVVAPHANLTTNNIEPTKVSKNAPKKAQLLALEAKIKELEEKDARRLARIQKLKADKKKLRKVQKNSDKIASIPKPVRTDKKAIKLRVAMGLQNNKAEYDALRRTVKFCTDHAGVNYKVKLADQEPARIARVYAAARNMQPALARYAGDWATAVFMKQLLRNRREYAKKMAAKGGVEEVDMDALDLGEEEEEEEDDGDDGEEDGEEDGGDDE